MKPAELKIAFVQLRAEGRSYDYIAQQLHIAKATCTKWEKDLAADIDELKRAELAELAESYGIAKEARIKNLGDTLERINAALNSVDFSTIDPAKLLEFKLKYIEALKGEYAGLKPAFELDSIDVKDIVAALGDLLNRVRAGDVTAEQAQKESAILSQLLKAYEIAEIQPKLNELETIVGGRQ